MKGETEYGGGWGRRNEIWVGDKRDKMWVRVAEKRIYGGGYERGNK
jgi:hypothetical protein